MKQIRLGIVGLGAVGSQHARRIVEDSNRDFRLGAVCSAIPEEARRVGKQYDVPFFTDARGLFDSRLCDAVLICTPHYLHPPLTIRAARAGLHMLCEKPVAVTAGPARAMVAQCRKRKVALGVMFQMRARGLMRAVKRMVAGGRLGEIFHVSMVCTNWYRTQAYYDSG